MTLSIEKCSKVVARTMMEKPIKREDPIIDIPMWSSILIGGVHIALLSMIFLTSDYIAVCFSLCHALINLLTNLTQDTFVRGGKHAEDVFLTAFFCFFIYSATLNAFNVRYSAACFSFCFLYLLIAIVC